MSGAPGEAGSGALASRLRLAVVRLNRRLRAQRTGTGLSLTQISAVSTLHKYGAMTPGRLAEREGVRPPSMTRVLAALAKLGYVVRSPHPSDGRQSIVELSPSGYSYVDWAVSVREAWLNRRLAELDEEERAVLARAAQIIERMAGSS